MEDFVGSRYMLSVGGIENEKEEARFGCGGLFQSDIKRFDWGGVQSSISPS